MKANEFVKKFGWDVTIDLWCGAFDLYNNDLQILNGMVCSFSNNQFLFELVDLKRFIESYELVESYGGLEKSKEHTLVLALIEDFEGLKNLQKFIVDVESCL